MDTCDFLEKYHRVRDMYSQLGCLYHTNTPKLKLYPVHKQPNNTIVYVMIEIDERIFTLYGNGMDIIGTINDKTYVEEINFSQMDNKLKKKATSVLRLLSEHVMMLYTYQLLTREN